MSDAEALGWLEQLLELSTEDRAKLLEQLAIDDRALHARVVRLLAAAMCNDSASLTRSARQEQSAPQLSFRASQSLAGYRLFRELGRGGMAAVWLAERVDGLLKRPVALKLPLFSMGSPLAAARFLQEKDVLAGLTHPHIAQLYDAGISEGQPFIVIEYVDGLPITDYCDRKRLDVRARMQLFLQVLEAVDHAHKHLVVHRDLKPSNMLVDAQGQVKLLDFGISKLLVDPSSAAAPPAKLTLLGDAVMTPAYAAPEQATGGEISTQTDIFVLGAVLHELLTGVLPYAAACGSAPTVASMINALLRENPTRPSQAPMDEAKAQARGVASVARLRASLRGDLDTITYKALQYDPAQRYGSAEHFADDLRRFLASRPISARAPGAAYSLGLFLRRNRAVSVAACVGGVLSLLGAATAVEQYVEARVSAAHASAVRDFMFEFVNDGEPTESQSANEITGLQMLSSAVERARRTFPHQPELQGELLGELGRMYLRFEQPQTARQLMSEAIRIMQPAGAGNPALNHTRAQLARLLFTEHRVPEARALALAARAACTRRSVDCAKARYIASALLADIERTQGLVEQSQQWLRRAVAESTAAFGAEHAETAMALGKLALDLRDTGHLVEAGMLIERAVRQSAKQMLRKIERLRLQRAQLSIEMDLGRYQAVLQQLDAELPRAESTSERALQLRQLASVHLALGEPARALASADAAIAVLGADREGSEMLLARQVRAQALALLGHAQESALEIQRVIDDLLSAGSGAQSLEVLQAYRVRGEILLRNGRAAEAREELEILRDQLRALSQPVPLELGQTLDLLGCAQREMQLLAQARLSHDQAAESFSRVLPVDHPLVARNALYSTAVAVDRERFVQQAKRFKLSLAPSSIWRQVIDTHANGASCAVVSSAVCVLVL